MGKAKDQAGNIWETDAQGNAVRLIQPAPSSPMNNPMVDPRLQYQVQAAQGQASAAPYEGPKAAAELARTQQQITAQPLQNENTRVNIAQGQKSIQNTDFGNANTLRSAFNGLPEVKNYSDALQALGGAMKAPDSPQGDLAVVYAFAKAMDPGSVVREGEMDMANQTASIAQRLQQQYGLLTAGKRLPPEVRTGLLEAARQKVAGMRPLYDQQYARFADLAQKSNFNPGDVVGKPLYEAVRPIEEAYIKAHGGMPRDLNAITPDVQVATGAIRNEYDPELSSKIDALIRKGAPYSQAVALAKQASYPPPDANEYQRAVSYAKQNPQYRKRLAEANRAVPTTGFERFAASPIGAGISGAAKAGTLGFADEIAGAIQPGDYATNRDAFAANQNILAGEHPTADFAGQLAGGVPLGIGMGAAASRIPGAATGIFGANTPFPSLLSRGGVAGDVGFGAGYGAGSNNDDRLTGALEGGALGLGGGIAARGAINGVASAIAPTGGAMRPLYDMGVRPSIGQRLGGAFNNFEEKLQSIPLLGDAIAGTRGRAVDQYQVGLFNDALGQVGQKLPKGTGPGHSAHAFSQDAISRAYDTALSGMTAAADGQLSTDLGAIQRQIGTMKPDHQNQFTKIWSDSVARRFQGGQLSGDAYKAAESELSRRVAKLRSNPADNDLADALEQATGALRSSALRNSPPEAVAALDAADAAHARIVRIENASRTGAGEPAEFSPRQYATATKTSSGGVRNRNYLRGDALNAELATLGNRLGDKVSNSGSIDRLLAGGALYGLNSVSPASAGVLAGLTGLNAPGVRNAVTELMAPRANPIFDRTAEQLRQRARLGGMFGAPLALDLYGQ